MSSVGGGFKRDDFWSTASFDEDNNPCPYNLRKYMSKARFDAITAALTFTDKAAPTYTDRFWDMITAWNANMAANFSAAWILCLDESMSIWHNRFTCPGWVFCPRKPYPFGNEYHSACCGKSGIMFSIEMVEGKDKPAERGTLTEFEDQCGKTGGLLLRMLRSYFNTGRYVVFDSGFCVLQAIVALYEKGIFAGALIKKRKFWPKYIPGAAIDNWFSDKAVGAVEALTGMLTGIRYFVWGMKEPDYTMKIMATGGVLASDESCKIATLGMGASLITFPYTKPFDWHFRYRHAVDDDNNLRHALPSIEDTSVTTRWPVRAFTFLISITEINIYLAKRFFVWTKEQRLTFVQFRRGFSKALIKNPLLSDSYGNVGADDVALDVSCDVVTAPRFAREYRNCHWVCDAKSPYQQYVCKWPGCTKQVRTCCACTLGNWLCTGHIIEHAVLKATGELVLN